MDILKSKVSAAEVEKFFEGKKKNQAFILDVDFEIPYALVQDANKQCFYVEPNGKGTATIFSLKTTEEKIEIFNKIRDLQ